MKKFLSLTLVAYCSFNPVQAQNFGNSTTGALPNVSAGLDVDFTNKGVLIPRVALSSLTDAVTISTPATSLFVYSKGGAITDGYYYNSGTPVAPIWSSFITTASTGNGCFTNWQLYSANGTFIVPAGITKIKVCVFGGGAGGGGGSNGVSDQYGGGGGGAGGYAEGIYSVSPAANFIVTIGPGGTGGTTGFQGSNGGTSSFGVLISATGGLGGVSYTLGGTGGVGNGGYLNTSLGNGGGGSYGAAGSAIAANGTGGGGTGAITNTIFATGGGGGGGGFGGGNGGYLNTTGDNALVNTGAGGGGGAGGGVGHNGGNGAAGKVIVFW